jgi:hypothetical protein
MPFYLFHSIQNNSNRDQYSNSTKNRATAYGIPNEKNNKSGNNAMIVRNPDPAKVNRVSRKSKNFAVHPQV